MKRSIVALLGLVVAVIAASPKRTNAQDSLCNIESPTILVGQASWYGPRFHGKKTATGKVFDQNDPSMAACLDGFKNACLRVTNLENRRSLTVACRDTGSFCEKYGRIIDLSEAGAIRLGYKTRGEADVRVEPVACES